LYRFGICMFWIVGGIVGSLESSGNGMARGTEVKNAREREDGRRSSLLLFFFCAFQL
jgi:hypothetical protein